MLFSALRRFRKRQRMSATLKESVALVSKNGDAILPAAQKSFNLCKLLFQKKLYNTHTAIIEVFEKKNGDRVVRKRVELEGFKQSEVAILKAVVHPLVVKFFDYKEPTNDVPFHSIYMEYVETDLYFFQDREEFNEGMPENIIRDIFAQLLEGVEYLHSLKICHRDLKPENILISENNKIKIADFGHGVFFSPGEWFKNVVGTFEYMPPEVVLGEPHNHKVDQWALGAILLTLFNHINPFLLAASHEENHPFRHKKCVEENIVFMNYRVTEDRNPSAYVWDLVHLMLCRDPTERQEICLLRNHRPTAPSAGALGTIAPVISPSTSPSTRI